MTEPRFRERGVTELVDAAFTLYRQHAGTYMVAGAIAYTPLLLLRLVLIGGNEGVSLASILLWALFGLVSLVTYSLMTGLIATIGSRSYLGEEVDLAEALREVRPRLGTLIRASINKNIYIGFGAFLLLVGAFYFATTLFAVEQVVILERASSQEAMKRSGTLSDGRKGHIFLALLLVYVIYFVLSGGAAVAVAFSKSAVLNEVISTLSAIVLYPMIGLTQLMLYYDARIRAEGMDLDVMAARLDRAPAGGAPSA